MCVFVCVCRRRHHRHVASRALAPQSTRTHPPMAEVRRARVSELLLRLLLLILSWSGSAACLVVRSDCASSCTFDDAISCCCCCCLLCHAHGHALRRAISSPHRVLRASRVSEPYARRRCPVPRGERYRHARTSPSHAAQAAHKTDDDASMPCIVHPIFAPKHTVAKWKIITPFRRIFDWGAKITDV